MVVLWHDNHEACSGSDKSLQRIKCWSCQPEVAAANKEYTQLRLPERQWSKSVIKLRFSWLILSQTDKKHGGLPNVKDARYKRPTFVCAWAGLLGVKNVSCNIIMMLGNEPRMRDQIDCDCSP